MSISAGARTEYAPSDGISHRDAGSERRVRATDGRDRLTTAVFLLLWVGCAIGGGSSRPDNGGLLIQRPITIVCLFLLLIVSRQRDWRLVRTPLLLLCLFAGLMLAQLIPLPPGIWHALPGRSRFAEALILAGAEQSWLPLSIAPDRTWNSFADLSAPAAVLIGYAIVPQAVRDRTVPGLIALGLISAFIGIIQMSGGEGSPLYVYTKSSASYPIGLLANRNHAGALLALLIPALRVWSLARPTSSFSKGRRQAIAAALALFLIPMIFVTGSRAGAALLAIGVVAAYLIKPVRIDLRRISPRLWLLIGGALAGAGLALWAVLASGRAIAINRLVSGVPVTADLRFDFAPIVIQMIRASFPVGWGFGTFIPVFRSFEPDWALGPTYFNNAHDDLLELLLTGGVPAALLLAAFVVWVIRRAIRAFRIGERSGSVRARAAAMMIGMVFSASLVDYPLRAPLIGAVFALLCAWLADGPEARRVASARGGM